MNALKPLIPAAAGAAAIAGVLASTPMDNRTPLEIMNQAILNRDDKCSAVLVDDEKNLIVTASHCVTATDEHVPLWLATYEDGKVKERKLFFGKVVKYDKVHDLAVLQATAPDFPDGTAVRIAEETPAVGETVHALGNPLMLPYFFSTGVVSKIWDMQDTNFVLIFSDVKVDHGSSGGALINDNNELVGITTGGIGITMNGLIWASDQWSFSVDSRYVRKLIEEINGYVL